MKKRKRIKKMQITIKEAIQGNTNINRKVTEIKGNSCHSRTFQKSLKDCNESKRKQLKDFIISLHLSISRLYGFLSLSFNSLFYSSLPCQLLSSLFSLPSTSPTYWLVMIGRRGKGPSLSFSSSIHSCPQCERMKWVDGHENGRDGKDIHSIFPHHFLPAPFTRSHSLRSPTGSW